MACRGEQVKIVLYLSSDGRFLRADCPQAEKRFIVPDDSDTKGKDDAKDDRFIAPMPEDITD